MVEGKQLIFNEYPLLQVLGEAHKLIILFHPGRAE